jgi:hypothetical protein
MASTARVLSRGFATAGANKRRFFVGGNWKANGTSADVQVRLPCERARARGAASRESAVVR